MLTGNAALSLDMYLPAFPDIANDLDISITAVESTLSPFLIGFAIGQIFYGPISDKIGRRPVIFFGLFLYSITSLICAFINDISYFYYLRFIQGIAGAAGAVLGRAVIRDLFNGHSLAQAMSLLMLFITAAPLAAPPIGAIILHISGWRYIFIALSSYAIIWIILIYFLIPESSQNKNKSKLKPSFILYSFFRVFKNKQAVGYTLSTSFAFSGLFSYIASTPSLYIGGFGLSPLEYALLFSSNVLGMAFFSILNRKALSIIKLDKLFLIYLIIILLSSLIMFAFSFFKIGGIFGVTVPLFFYIGILSPMAANGITGTLIPFRNDAGSASSFFGFFQFGIGSISVFIISQFNNITPTPLTLALLVSAVASFYSYILFLREN